MTSTATNLAPPSLEQRLDRLPATGWHIGWIIILGIAFVLESFDNLVFAYVAPSVQADWKLSLGQVGFITAAVFIGMFVGALVGGRLSDHVGRKPLIVWGSVLYGLASAYSALSPNFGNLFTSRILAGIGVEAATGVMLVYISETFPRKSRGRFVSIVILIGGASTPLTSFLALAIAPRGIEAWRWVFAIGGVGAIIGIIIALTLPETVRWLDAHGKSAKALSIVSKLETSASANGKELPQPIATPVVPVGDGTIRQLFRPPYLKRLIATGLIFGVFVYALYGWISWVPVVLVHNGMTQTQALTITSVISLFSFAAPVLLFLFGDRIQRKTAIFLECGIGGIAMILFGFMHDTTGILIVGAIVLVAVSSATGSFYTYIPEIFPTDVRGVGTGSVNAFARIAGVVQGITVGLIVGSIGSINLYIILGAAWIVVALAIMLLGRKTTRLSVEESGGVR